MKRNPTAVEDSEKLALRDSGTISLFLCGDVMTGRGIDQVLHHPSNPRIYETHVKDARVYVRLAEKKNGPVPRPVPYEYIWGDALSELVQRAPDVRLINLETAVTKSENYWKGKGINYRMHPENIPCLTAAHIDVCSLANNHILDWGYEGLSETLRTLRETNIKVAGAGKTLKEAFHPALIKIKEKGRVIIFSFGMRSSGIPSDWAATNERPGLNVLDTLTSSSLLKIREKLTSEKQPGDLLVASIHWGGNWGYEISGHQKSTAHQLIDEVGFDVIHGHSSHHVKGIEVYKGKPILYGCGDFLTDYEGISGYEGFRDDLTLMYFVKMDTATGRLVQLQMVPMQIKNFRLKRPSNKDTKWLFSTLRKECKKLGAGVDQDADGTFSLSLKKN